MKKIITLLFIAFCSNSVNSQDIIVKKDGSLVKAKITEVEEDLIKYKKFDNPDGPNYTISKSNIASINYANGEVEKFSTSETKKVNEDEDSEDREEKEEKPAKNEILSDANLKKTIEGIAKDVGEQIIRNCASGKVDNSTSEVYWDGVYRDAITKELIIPIRASWNPKFNEGNPKWVKGKIIVSTNGTKKWVYQNNNGLVFSGCATGFKIK